MCLLLVEQQCNTVAFGLLSLHDSTIRIANTGFNGQSWNLSPAFGRLIGPGSRLATHFSVSSSMATASRMLCGCVDVDT